MEIATLHKILKGHKHKVTSVAFSSDNKLIASACSDDTVRLWNIPNGDLNAELKGHESEVSSVAFSPDVQSIVTGSCDRTVRTWSIQPSSNSKYSMVILAGFIRLHGHQMVWFVSFSQNGNKLASASWDCTVIIWDVNSGAALITLAHSQSVYSVCFSHDDQFAVTGGSDNIVRMFNVNTGHEEKRFEGHTSYVYSVAISFDGSMIASGSSDNSVRLWDVASTKQLQQLDRHNNWVESVAFSRDDKFIASGSWDGTVRLWERDIFVECFYR